MSNLREVINYWAVESIRLTSETTVCVWFISGMSRVFEFVDPDDAERIVSEFTEWCDTTGHFGQVIRQSELK